LAGVDILASDKLGKLGCTLKAVKRDELVFELCSNTKFLLQVSMGGGYSPELKPLSKRMLILL
jgi:acetoin utilization deacetylase AcuC-like enzyme